MIHLAGKSSTKTKSTRERVDWKNQWRYRIPLMGSCAELPPENIFVVKNDISTFKMHFSKSPRNTLGDVMIQEELLTNFQKLNAIFSNV